MKTSYVTNINQLPSASSFYLRLEGSFFQLELYRKKVLIKVIQKFTVRQDFKQTIKTIEKMLPEKKTLYIESPQNLFDEEKEFEQILAEEYEEENTIFLLRKESLAREKEDELNSSTDEESDFDFSDYDDLDYPLDTEVDYSFGDDSEEIEENY